MADNILANVVYLCANVFRIYTVFLFISLFVKREQVSKYKELVFYSGYFVLNSAGHLFLQNPLINVSSNIIIIFIILLLCYETKLGTSILVTFVIFSLGILSENIVFVLLHRLLPDILESSLVIVIDCLIMCMIAVIIKNHLDMKSNEIISKYQILAMISICVISVFLALSTTLRVTRNNHLFISISLVLVLVMNFMVLYLYDSVKDRAKRIRTEELLRQQNNNYLKQFQIILQSQQELRIFRHDLRGHLLSIRALLERGNFEGALGYINDAYSMISTQGGFISSGNVAVDSVLNSKIQEAKSYGIEIKTTIKIPDDLRVAAFDLSAILYNLVDNAIHAVALLDETDKRIVWVSMEMDRGVLYICVQNPYNGDIVYKNGVIQTTHEDSINHGYGLQSVRKAVEKYSGVLNVKPEDGMFTVDIMMYDEVSQ